MDIGGAIREVPPWGWAAAGGGALILVVWRSRKHGATTSQQLVPVSAVGQPNIPASGGTLSGGGDGGSGGGQTPMDWSPFTDAMTHEESMFSDMFGQVNTQMAAENQTLSDLTHAISALQTAQATGSGNDQHYMDIINGLIARMGQGNSTSVTSGNPATSSGYNIGPSGSVTSGQGGYTIVGGQPGATYTGLVGGQGTYTITPGGDIIAPFIGGDTYVNPWTQPQPSGAYPQSPVAVGQAAGTVMGQNSFGSQTIGESLGRPADPPPPPSQIKDPSSPNQVYWTGSRVRGRM